MTWMQRLKRVFNIDIEISERCGGQVKVIASIEDPTVIAHILKHLKQNHRRWWLKAAYTASRARTTRLDYST